MFKHVGGKNYRAYFECVRRCLKDGGLSVLPTIGTTGRPAQIAPWIDKYIFPNAKMPTASELTAALEGLFVVGGWPNFGTGYDRTLMAWGDNIEAAWAGLPPSYNARLRRMERYYLDVSAAVFCSRSD